MSRLQSEARGSKFSAVLAPIQAPLGLRVSKASLPDYLKLSGEPAIVINQL